MNTQEEINYNRIAKAIAYILANFKNQPGLYDIADETHLSPFHFQRLFQEWVGLSPKKFLQYVSIGHAKKLLQERATLLDTAHETGLSGISRLHDLFVNIEGMTPAEYKNGGINLKISYSFAVTPFGPLLIASTQKGVCWMAFYEDELTALDLLRQKFPNASFQLKNEAYQDSALQIFQDDWTKIPKIRLHLKGTDFQMKVWEALLKIPMGQLATYGSVAQQISNPAASRAVGTAIGSNPIAFLIPCHRVIQSTGHFGGYMWGPIRKTAIIGWECAKTEQTKVGHGSI